MTANNLLEESPDFIE